MDEPDGYLLYLIKQVEAGVRRPLDERLAREGFNTPSYTALTVLQRRPGITSSELARRSFVRPQSMAETVNALLTAGLVRRENDPAHGRQKLLFITEEGDRRATALRGVVRELDVVLDAALTPEDRAELIQHLRAVRDLLAQLSDADRAARV